MQSRSLHEIYIPYPLSQLNNLKFPSVKRLSRRTTYNLDTLASTTAKMTVPSTYTTSILATSPSALNLQSR